MRLPPYPKYKPSGVEWLGDVPEHWGAEPLKYSTDFINGMAFKPESWSTVGVPIVRIENLNGGLDFNCCESDVPARYHVSQGDLLFGWSGNRGTSFGPFLWWRDGLHYLNQHIFKLTAFTCDKSWFYWCLKAVTRTIEDEAHGIIGMVHVTRGRLGAVPIPLVTLGEQGAIANFLDRETAKIDTLVARKRTLIERLKEKRTALISRTVTRGLPPHAARAAGLDPHPKLKPSGIAWLGDLPEHWRIPPLYTRYQVDLGKMLHEGAISGDHLVPYLRNVDVQWNQIDVSDLPEMDIGPWELARYTVRCGDVLVCEGGEVGRAAMVGDDAHGLGYQKALHRLRPLAAHEAPRFMFYTLYWAAQHGVFIAGGNPNTIPHLTGEKLRAYRLPTPPYAEQRTIADFLDRETAKIDGMVTKVKTAIERLQEYRTALITEAVTGKIDVRNAEVEIVGGRI